MPSPRQEIVLYHPAVAALRRVTVSKCFWRVAWELFPRLKQDESYWRLFSYLLFGSWFDKDTNQLLLCADILSAIEDRDTENSQAEKFLIRFREDVLRPVGGQIQWTGWNKKGKKCRQLRKLHFGGEFAEILRREHFGEWDDGGRVYILDGSAFNRSSARRFCREQRDEAGRLPALCEHAERIRVYMNTLNSNLFTKKVRANFRSALKATFNLADGPVKDAQLRVLRHINSQPQPFYFPSEKGHTVRLSTRESIPNLKGNVRRALTKGWAEADLRCSQFAICATLWNVEDLLDFLRSGQSLWLRLFDFLGLRPEERELAKSILKRAIYSICYGMQRVSVKGLTAYDLVVAGLDKIIAHKLLEEPLVKTLHNARNVALETIAAEGGAMTCYNDWLAVTEERQPRDIMAEVAQAWEMKLIYPAFELASTSSDFKITLYQYDGFCVHFVRRPETWKQRIEESINWHANRHGFLTWLEWS